MAVERIIPEAVETYDPVDLREHLARYEFAYQYVKDGFVGLDIACGSGYGTNMLTRDRNVKFYGVDICPKTVDYARAKYGNEKIEFMQKDATAVDFAPQSFDLIVSFETIEHIKKENGPEFLKRMQNLLKDNGTLIISCPNRDTYSKGYNENPYHLYEYSFPEISELIKTYFSVNKTYCHKIRYFKKLPKKFAQLLKHLPSSLVNALTNMAKKQYLADKNLNKINPVLRIFLYERYFGDNFFPYIENYNAYKPSAFIFVCKKRRI